MILFALLFVGCFLAAMISGSAGFGGALLLLPLLTATVGVTEAVPLLTVAQLMGNLSRAGFGFREIRWRPVLIFLVAAVPFSALGAFWFASISPTLAMRFIGVAILAFVMLKALGLMTLKPTNTLLFLGGGTVGLLSGLIGSAGPLGAAVFLTLNLPPVAYIASEAVTALAMHATKTVIYGSELRLSASFWPLALALGVAMILGLWASRRIIERVPTIWFGRFVSVLLIASAVQMIVAS
jgi:uncharacterized protein